MRIGMVKLGGWGDGADGAVLATAIKKKYPGSSLVVITDSKAAKVLYEHVEAVDACLLTDKDYTRVVKEDAWKFDLFFDFRPHVAIVYKGDWYKQRMRLARKIDRKIARRYRHYNSWETNKLQDEGKTVVELALESADLRETSYDEVRLKRELPPNPYADEEYITISISAAGSRWGKEQTKCWEHDRWQAVVDWLVDRGYKVVQLGLRGERKLRRCEHVWSKPVEVAMSVLRDSFLHLGIENGPVRVRRLLTKKPSIVLFGPTHPVMYGLEGNINIWKGVCRPCFWYTGDWMWRCAMGWDRICMRVITVEDVLRKIEEVLKRDEVVDSVR